MPIIVPSDPFPIGPYAPETATVLATRSPYWLRVNDVWCHLEGVTPGTTRTAERPTSELVTVDGVRHVQRAPRAPREWTLDFSHATSEALALVGLAAELDEVWLLDETAAAANMLAPRDCYGSDPDAPVVDCGGMPLRSIAASSVTVNVRGDVPLELSLWSDAAEGTSVATAAGLGILQPITTPAGTGVRRASVAVSANDDGDLTIGVEPPVTAVASGLQVREVPATSGPYQPQRWLAGERTPCMVAVGDPERTLERIREGLGYGSYSVTLREVG